MQTFKHVIEVREFAEQINQQFPFCQPDAKRKVTWHTHSPIIVPRQKRIKEQA